MRRVLITGSRGWTDRDTISNALWAQVIDTSTEMMVVHGGAPGADLLAKKVALYAMKQGYAVDHEQHDARWEKPCSRDCWQHRRKRRGGTTYCPKQGSIRNQEMVDCGADVCLAFPLANSIGTWDCMRRAKAAGIEVINYGVER